MLHRPSPIVLIALAMLGPRLPAQARPPVPVAHPALGNRIKFDTRKFMHVRDVKPGMRGYALTVFKGTKIERFGIVVLGVVSKLNAGQDYILFRCTSGPPVTRHLNIAHGMSGSPIYINGKLVGAISMGLPFMRDPIGLATPIEEMFDAWSPDLPSKISPISATATPANAGSVSAERVDGYNVSAFQPLDVPLSVSGMTMPGITRLNAALAPFHFTAMPGGGSSQNDYAAGNNPLAQGATLQPGSAVGVSLVQGDIDVTATGTITYRDGNRILMFGHPLAGLGPIDAAMTSAYVVDIFPSYQDSIKMGMPIKTVGRIFQDRPFSVGGLVGSMPHMIPMTVSVNDEFLNAHKTFHVRIIDHPLLTSQFVTQIAGQAIQQVHGQPGDSVATVNMDVDVDEIGHVKRTNTFYDALSIDQSAIGDLDSLMHLLSSNPFYPLGVKTIHLDVTIQNRHDTAEIDHIFLKQSKFAPGDTVDVGVVLKPFKRDPVTRMIPVKIPSTVQNGTLTLSIKGGGSDSGGGISLGGGFILLQPTPSFGPAGTISQLVKQFTDKPHNNDLVAQLTLPTSGINIRGEQLSQLPPTFSSVMQSAHSSGLKLQRDEVKTIQATPYVVSGSDSLNITIQKKPVAETTAGVSSGSAPITTPSADTFPVSTSLDDTPSSTTASDDESAPRPAPVSMDWMTAGTSAPPAPHAGGTVTHPTHPLSTASPTPTPTPAIPSIGAAGATTATPAGSAVKTVGRLPSIWRQATTADFAAGTLKNVTVTSVGDVRLAAALQRVTETGETYLWSLLPDGSGHVYVGTGDRGNIYKMGLDGKMALFFKTGELEVTALAQDKAGNLYAGTLPHGLVFQISPSGQGRKFFTAKEKYVTALAFDTAQARLYIATGGGTGRVYAVPSTGVSIGPAWFTSPEAHILSLTLDKNGTVYAGAAPDGIVYKITPEGASQVLFDAVEPNVAALATDSTGNVYAGTTPKGNIYKIAPDGSVKLLYDRAPTGILSLRTDRSDNLYACAGATVYRISPDETVQSFVAPSDEQFVSLAADPSNGAVYAGTSTVGTIYKIGDGGINGLTGVFQSTVHDAGLPAHWGTLTWISDTPPGTHVTLQTRSGDVERPDTSWSSWSAPLTTPTGTQIASPPGRYLQYQAMLTSDATAGSAVPRLRAVTAYYLPRNQPATVKMVSPLGGEAFSKAALIQWSATDPDKDTLSYDLSYSGDGGKTWTPIKKKAVPHGPGVIPTPTPSPTAAPQTVTDQEVTQKVAQMRADLERQTNLPAAVRQQLLAQAPEMMRLSLHQQAAAPSASLKESSFSWDTTEVPDGAYQIEVLASDKPSNPVDWLTAKAISGPFLVANTSPSLTIGIPQIGAGKTVTLRGTVKTPVAFVKAVQGRLDGGDPLAAVADDGLFDSTLESFTLVTPPLSSGSHTLEVQALDQAGNLATAKVNVTVP